MKHDEAIDKMAKCFPPMSDTCDEVVIGRAVRILLSAGFHDIEYESHEDGSLTLHAGNIELTDEREFASRGHLQRSTELLVKAAIIAHEQESIQ